MSGMSAVPTITLDPRRRTSLAKVGRKQDTQYLVSEHDDGTLVLTPAITIPAAELAALADPDVRTAMERARTPGDVPARRRGSFARHAES
jgi:hypothetical protein